MLPPAYMLSYAEKSNMFFSDSVIDAREHSKPVLHVKLSATLWTTQ